MVLELMMTLSVGVMVVLFGFVMVTNSIVTASFLVKKKHVTNAPSVSIIIPVYNEEKTIRACLASVFASDYLRNKYEVIVVDDGSTDGTTKLVRVWKNVRLIKCNHEGKAAALTRGVKAANYSVVVTIDADTLLERDCLQKLVAPFGESDVGAVAGVTKVKNKSSFLGAFQNVEYYYNAVIRGAFSRLFGNTVWFHGAVAAYRKNALVEIGYFKSCTLAEDLDASLELYRCGYRTVHADACAQTVVPEKLTSLVRQRMRWSTGVFQSLKKNKGVVLQSGCPSLVFTLINQWWWSLFAVLSFPLFAVQIAYWFPYHASTLVEPLAYLVRWMSLWGPAYVIYKMPVWGVSSYNIFGVLSGLVSTLFMVVSLWSFKERLLVRNVFALFFYFPYTFVVNTALMGSIVTYKFYKEAFFIR